LSAMVSSLGRVAIAARRASRSAALHTPVSVALLAIGCSLSPRPRADPRDAEAALRSPRSCESRSSAPIARCRCSCRSARARDTRSDRSRCAAAPRLGRRVVSPAEEQAVEREPLVARARARGRRRPDLDAVTGIRSRRRSAAGA
jgi:hypothetical protein